MSRSPNTCAAMRRAARVAGFTLIELLVVLIIIAVIIAIVLPALGLARKSARAATTRNLLTQITSATGQFINDNKRTPGYFSARDMASTPNLTQGFSAMQNIMLDLAGFSAGTTSIGPGTTSGATQIDVELDAPGQTSFPPTATGIPALIGASNNSKSYFVPDGKHWKRQDGGGQQIGSAQNQFLASVIDDFGNPILAWAQDDTAVGQITTVNQFAKAGIGAVNDPSARFYWTPNSAFLGATALGTRAYNQVRPATAPPFEGSLIGSTSGGPAAVAPTQVAESLCGILGSPSYPYRAPAASAAPTVPASARAPLILHSAGADGVFFSAKDRGAKQFTQPYIDYQMSFVKSSGAPETQANFYLDKDGKREVFDVTKAFDDIIATGGN